METLNYRTGEAGEILLLFFCWDEYCKDGEVKGVPPNAHASWGEGGNKVGEVWDKPCKAQPLPMLHRARVGEGWGKPALLHKKTGPKRIRPSSLIKYFVYRFLALTPDIQKLVRLISVH